MNGGSGSIQQMLNSLEENKRLRENIRVRQKQNSSNTGKHLAFHFGNEATEEELSALRIQLETEKRKANLKRIKAILIITIISLTIFGCLFIMF